MQGKQKESSPKIGKALFGCLQMLDNEHTSWNICPTSYFLGLGT